MEFYDKEKSYYLLNTSNQKGGGQGRRRGGKNSCGGLGIIRRSKRALDQIKAKSYIFIYVGFKKKKKLVREKGFSMCELKWGGKGHSRNTMS